jgi:hypothetical protein
MRCSAMYLPINDFQLQTLNYNSTFLPCEVRSRYNDQNKNHMKKIFLLSSILFLSVASAQAQSSVISLYDDTLSLPGCDRVGANSCKKLDATESSNVQKTTRLERFVPGSGYLSVYFEDKSDRTSGFDGGFELSNAYFEPNTGGQIELGTGIQVFERGTVVLEFDQAYTDEERLASDYEFVIYYLPHTENERQGFLIRLQDDSNAFYQYKQREERILDPLCETLGQEVRLPKICPDVALNTPAATTGFDSSSNLFETDADDLPELDFTGKPRRAPIVTLRDKVKQTFIDEPVIIEVKDIFDPDGKCQFFDFEWRKSDGMNVRDVDVNPRLGDLFFIPENTGAFTVQLRIQEGCKELGTLYSDTVSIRVIVNDKTISFPDLAEAPEYQNSILELYHLGVVQGYPDGTMRPNAPINRAEFLKVIFETLQYRIDKESFSPRYTDVNPGEWFAPYIHEADSLGVIKGYPNGYFEPGWTVNLVEALKMAMNFSTVEILDDVVYEFSDVPNTEWYSRLVKTAFREGILDDIEPGQRVHPSQLLTRGKAMQIVVRTLIYPVNRINYANRDVLRAPDAFEDFSTFNY